MQDGLDEGYTLVVGGAANDLIQTQVPIYGSSRIGLYDPEVDLTTTTTVSSTFARRFLKQKQYELTNHLGNVLTTISDRKLKNSSGTIAYSAEIISAQDYYPFGMIMPGRNYNADKYRYGFNGKEMDDEIKGTGNQQDYGMRISDSRLGRFLSVDPLRNNFPWNSTYSFSENDVIRNVDLDGSEKHPYQYLPRWAQSTILVVQGVAKGTEEILHNICPHPQDERDPKSLSESIELIKSIPQNLKDLPKNTKEIYDHGSIEDKAHQTVMVLGLFSVLKGNINESNSLSQVSRLGQFESKTRLLTFLQGVQEKVKQVVRVPDGFEVVKVDGAKADVFKLKGKNVWISPDLDGHLGGIWKMANGKAENLFKKETREGTYNLDLTKRIGD